MRVCVLDDLAIVSAAETIPRKENSASTTDKAAGTSNLEKRLIEAGVVASCS